MRELNRRKAKVAIGNVNAIKQASVIDLSNSLAEEGNRKMGYDDSIDPKVNSKSEPHVAHTQLSFPVMDDNVSWHKTFPFENSEGEECLCSFWSKAFPMCEVLDQNFVDVNDLSKLEKVGFIGACEALQHYGVSVGVVACLLE